MDQLYLEHFPQGIILLEEGKIVGYNEKATEIFPTLPQGTISLTQFAGEGGQLHLPVVGTLSYKKSEAEGRSIVTLELEREPGLSQEQTSGVFREIRGKLSEIETVMTLMYEETRQAQPEEQENQEEQEAENPNEEDSILEKQEKDQKLAAIYKNLVELRRIVDNGDYLNESQLHQKMVSLDLAGLCRQLSQQVAPMLAAQGVTLHDQKLPVSVLVMGDSLLIRKILLELMSNFTREGTDMQISLTTHGSRAVVCLKGVNSKDEEEEKEKYQQELKEILEGKTTGQKLGEGAGLGLPVIHRLVSHLRGTFVAHRNAKGELEFYLSLALAKRTNLQLSSAVRKRTPDFVMGENGGIPDILLELSPVLGKEFFLPEDMEE